MMGHGGDLCVLWFEFRVGPGLRRRRRGRWVRRSRSSGHRLVYGGGHVGLMGVVADAALGGRRRGHRRDDRAARRCRGRPPRPDRTGGHPDHACPQGADGRAVRRRDRAARRVRNARRDVRDDHLEPARSRRRARGVPRRRRLLRVAVRVHRASVADRFVSPANAALARRAVPSAEAVRLATSAPEAFTPKWE